MTPEQEADIRERNNTLESYYAVVDRHTLLTAYDELKKENDEQAREIARLREICDAFKTEFAERYRIDVDVRLREMMRD